MHVEPNFSKFLSQFTEAYLTYRPNVHTVKSSECARTSLQAFLRIVGHFSLHKIGARGIERFVAMKTSEASERTAWTGSVTLAGPLETTGAGTMPAFTG